MRAIDGAALGDTAEVDAHAAAWSNFTVRATGSSCTLRQLMPGSAISICASVGRWVGAEVVQVPDTRMR